MLTLVLLAAMATPTPAPPLASPACVIPGGTTIHLELALTDQEKVLGLMFRDNLPADRGMLFPFKTDSNLPFWMKNTYIPLDFVWLDASGTVVDVRSDVPPCESDPCPSYSSHHPARAVLEVNAGFAAAHGIHPGVKLSFEGVPGYPVPEGAK